MSAASRDSLSASRFAAGVVIVIATVSVAAAQEPDRPRAAEWLRRADADGDGRVTKSEFLKARSADLEENFSRLDANGNGIVEEEEAERAIGMMRGVAGMARDGGRRPEGAAPGRGPGPGPAGRGTGEEMDMIFHRMDRDGDGKLSRDEFTAGMSRLREMMQQRGGGLPGQAAGRPGGPEEGFRRPPRPDGADGGSGDSKP